MDIVERNPDICNAERRSEKRIRQLHGALELQKKMQAEADASDNPSEVHQKYFKRLWEAVGFNPLYLTAGFYPKYHLNKDGVFTPLSFTGQPFSLDTTEWRPRGISVERGSRQLGKTTKNIAESDILCTILPNYEVLYVAPRPKQLQSFAIKYKAAADMNAFRVTDKGLKVNMYSREYPENSRIRMIYALTHAGNARGITCSLLNIDEAQDLDPGLFEDIAQTIGRVSIGQIRVGGTAKRVDTFLEESYQRSSQGTHVIPCPSCHYDNDTGDVDTCIGMIRPEGLCCRKCGSRLDPATALIVHKYPSRLEEFLYGVHTPQIVIPRIANDLGEWNGIYAALHRSDDISKFVQEVLGIPVEESSRELTERELIASCVLNFNAVRRPDNLKKYAMILSGCDWGGSDDNPVLKMRLSRTAHVVIGVTPEFKIDILHMRTYPGMGYERIAAQIMQDHKAFGGNHLFADAGVGHWYNDFLRIGLGGNHTSIAYGGNPGRVLSPMLSGKEAAYTAHKTESLSCLFDMIRTGNIRCYEWERAKEEYSELLNIIRAPQETAAGDSKMIYRRVSNRSDDIAHALNFALMGAHILAKRDVRHTHELAEQYIARKDQEEMRRRRELAQANQMAAMRRNAVRR